VRMRQKWEGLKAKAILGSSRNKTIYSKVVIPLSQAEQIELSQKHHIRAQKCIKKAIKLLQKARHHVENMPLANNKGADMVSKEIDNLRKLSERLKKYYYDRLPYITIDDIGSEQGR